MNDETILSEDELQFFNISLVFVFFKLKEFPNTRILAEEVMYKLKKQVMFTLDD
jgi:hypothetical protein